MTASQRSPQAAPSTSWGGSASIAGSVFFVIFAKNLHETPKFLAKTQNTSFTPSYSQPSQPIPAAMPTAMPTAMPVAYPSGGGAMPTAMPVAYPGQGALSSPAAAAAALPSPCATPRLHRPLYGDFTARLPPLTLVRVHFWTWLPVRALANPPIPSRLSPLSSPCPPRAAAPAYPGGSAYPAYPTAYPSRPPSPPADDDAPVSVDHSKSV